MNWSGKRIIAACLLTVAFGLMLCSAVAWDTLHRPSTALENREAGSRRAAVVRGEGNVLVGA